MAKGKAKKPEEETTEEWIKRRQSMNAETELAKVDCIKKDYVITSQEICNEAVRLSQFAAKRPLVTLGVWHGMSLFDGQSADATLERMEDTSARTLLKRRIEHYRDLAAKSPLYRVDGVEKITREQINELQTELNRATKSLRDPAPYLREIFQ